MTDETTASFLDKTDWRITIHRKLEACVDAEGTELYAKRVKSLISAVSANYPGWDAEKEINTEWDRIKKKYSEEYTEWLNENLTTSKFQKRKMFKYYYNQMHKDIFTFIKNMCARKRMLLWGSKKVGGGTQMEYED